ncbi:MAG: acyltransferase [Candidatus Muproteobacteria bacterium RBG_16_64_10]|uniref:Acyltransferase n=1 Tax=Candidatus Muproteobacteria bacterium RBG_16_64_10 TaxID=1817757 RepID=A0A1F6SWD8_9PROT|nr:MAG: acyltransferase [Candidatus Muproteobacteria bacterium RBG_16_64_10]
MSTLAAIQMASGPEVAQNLAAAEQLIATAAQAGAGLVALPENFALMAGSDAERLAAAEDDGRGPIQDFLAEAARRHRIWLVGGTLPIKAQPSGKARATCLLFDDHGRRVARYDKIHLFDVQLPNGEQYRESAAFEPGSEIVVADTPFGKLGLAVCYDLRFPELFRAMLDRSAEVFAVPSAFTALTGRAHWEILVRARAVENLAYVIAAAQGGRHASGRETWGHSMIVDPWGEVLARQETGAGVALAVCDRARLAEIRAQLPSLRHRRIKEERFA